MGGSDVATEGKTSGPPQAPLPFRLPFRSVSPVSFVATQAALCEVVSFFPFVAIRSFDVQADRVYTDATNAGLMRFLEYAAMSEPLRDLLNGIVVLDTTLPILYLGTLVEVTEHALVLESADMHDCRDGHANKEQYLLDAQRDGVAVNRKRIVVMRATVISVSRLEDIAVE